MEAVNISILRRLELKGEAFTNFEMSSKGFTWVDMEIMVVQWD